MKTVEELSNEAEQLQQRVQQIETEKVAAKQREYDQKLSLIGVHEAEAAGYREQAERAAQVDKKALYLFAAEADRLAIDLRKELGLYSEVDAIVEQDSQQKTERKKLLRINSLLLKSAVCFALYLGVDYVSNLLESGLIAFIFDQSKKVFFFGAGAFGGCWFAMTILFEFVPSYVLGDLQTDFETLPPFQKLALLAALLFGLFHLLNGIIPYAT